MTKGEMKILIPASIGCFLIGVGLFYLINWIGGIFFIALGIILAYIGR